jgi:hypothetical protein
VWGSLKILTNRDTVDRLRAQRSDMQRRIRIFADANAPSPEMKGWWQDPEGHTAELRAALLEDEAGK